MTENNSIFGRTEQGLPPVYGGFRIVTDESMVEPGEPYEAPRTWFSRLFTLPWRPFRATTVTPMAPKKEVLRAFDTLIMHPAVAKELEDRPNEL